FSTATRCMLPTPTVPPLRGWRCWVVTTPNTTIPTFGITITRTTSRRRRCTTASCSRTSPRCRILRCTIGTDDLARRLPTAHGGCLPPPARARPDGRAHRRSADRDGGAHGFLPLPRAIHLWRGRSQRGGDEPLSVFVAGTGPGHAVARVHDDRTGAS